jgi:predicted amidohydrolase
MRKVRVSSIRPLEPDRTVPLQENIIKFLPHVLELLAQAGQNKTDIAILPEDYFFMAKVHEAVMLPCEITDRAGEIAKKFGMYIIFPVIEEREGKKYNASLIIDRNGSVINRYDKTHLTTVEIEKMGLTPGDSLPVFDLDFGKIGIMTCYEIYFQEIPRILALKGAEIIIFPHQIAEPGEIFWETLVKARAADNCVYVVASSFGVPNGMAWHPGRNDGHYAHDGYYRNIIVGMDGEKIADGGYEVGMTMADIDLDLKRMVYNIGSFGCSDLKEQIFKFRRPELYHDICKI